MSARHCCRHKVNRTDKDDLLEVTAKWEGQIQIDEQKHGQHNISPKCYEEKPGQSKGTAVPRRA